MCFCLVNAMVPEGGVKEVPEVQYKSGWKEKDMSGLFFTIFAEYLSFA